MPPVYALLGAGALVAGIIGGIQTNELGPALGVMIPAFGWCVVTAILLHRGSPAGWWMWTVALGFLVVGCIAGPISAEVKDSRPPQMIAASGGPESPNPTGTPVALAMLFGTIAFVAVAWRASSKETQKIVSVAYALVVASASMAFLVGAISSSRLRKDASGCVLLLLTAALLIWTYSMRVRWWHSVRLGWTGGYLHGSHDVPVVPERR